MKCRKSKIFEHVRKNHRCFQTRAQANQIFTWMIALIMMSLLILFGYRAISGLRERGEQAQYLEFTNKLENLIGSTMSYGSGRRVSPALPGDYTGICFIGKNPVDIQIQDPIIKGHVDDGLQENAFLMKGLAEPPPLYVGEIDVVDDDGVSDGVLCIEAKFGKINFKIDGYGTYAEISSD